MSPVTAVSDELRTTGHLLYGRLHRNPVQPSGQRQCQPSFEVCCWNVNGVFPVSFGWSLKLDAPTMHTLPLLH